MCFNKKKPKFTLQVSPEKLVIPTKGHLEITISGFDTYLLAIVELNSYLFKILDPLGKKPGFTQIYDFKTKGQTIKFRIAARDPTETEVDFSDSALPNTPEGILTIKHATFEVDWEEGTIKDMKSDKDSTGIIYGQKFGDDLAEWKKEVVIEQETEEFKNLKTFMKKEIEKEKKKRMDEAKKQKKCLIM